MFFLGIDAGTSQLKAGIFDEGGVIVDTAACPIGVLTPFDGACEMDMLALWDAVCALIRRMKQRNPLAFEEISVCITGQGDGLWPVDAAGRPVRNAILWNDTRSKHVQLNNREAITQTCINHHANDFCSGSVSILLRWMRDFEPENAARISKALHCKDWLNFCLTGELFTDYTDASTALFDLKAHGYSDATFSVLGIEDFRRAMPDLMPAGAVLGAVTQSAAQATGIPAGAPVYMGAVDVICTAYGAGLRALGDACVIMGTTLCNEMVLELEQADLRSGLVLCHVTDACMCLMPTLNGTFTIDWAKELLFPGSSFEALDAMLLSSPPGDICFHPYLYGERAPFRNPFASGGFFGLKAHHTRTDMMKAVYEGLVMAVYDCFTQFTGVNEHMHMFGGGSNSRFLCQTTADILNKTVLKPKEGQFGLVGCRKLMQGLEESAAIDYESYIPDAENGKAYRERYEHYRELQEVMRPFWR